MQVLLQQELSKGQAVLRQVTAEGQRGRTSGMYWLMMLRISLCMTCRMRSLCTARPTAAAISAAASVIPTIVPGPTLPLGAPAAPSAAYSASCARAIRVGVYRGLDRICQRPRRLRAAQPARAKELCPCTRYCRGENVALLSRVLRGRRA